MSEPRDFRLEARREILTILRACAGEARFGQLYVALAHRSYPFDAIQGAVEDLIESGDIFLDGMQVKLRALFKA